MSTDKNANEEIFELLKHNKITNRHSFFQLRYFLVNKEPTNQSKLWRCLRELAVRQDGLKAMELEIEDGKDNMALIDIEIRELEQPDLHPELCGSSRIDKEVSEIKLRKAIRRRDGTKATIASLEERVTESQEEAIFLLSMFKSLEKIEPLKPYDDLDAQKEYWNEKIKQEFLLRSLLGSPPDLELAKTTLALGDDMQVKQELLAGLIDKRKSLEIEAKSKNKEV